MLLRKTVIRNNVIRNFVIRNFDIRNLVPVPSRWMGSGKKKDKRSLKWELREEVIKL